MFYENPYWIDQASSKYVCMYVSKYYILLFVRPSGVYLILPLLTLFQDGNASL
jgi:hypothetical protein